jgi:hypothetical protein
MDYAREPAVRSTEEGKYMHLFIDLCIVNGLFKEFFVLIPRFPLLTLDLLTMQASN